MPKPRKPSGFRGFLLVAHVGRHFFLGGGGAFGAAFASFFGFFFSLPCELLPFAMTEYLGWGVRSVTARRVSRPSYFGHTLFDARGPHQTGETLRFRSSRAALTPQTDIACGEQTLPLRCRG